MRVGDWMRCGARLARAGLVLCLIGSCQSVAGLPDKTDGQSQCEHYCDLSLTLCPEQRRLSTEAEDLDNRVHRSFETAAECMAFCGQMQPLLEKEGGATPLECRIQRLEGIDADSDPKSPDRIARCNDASPTGGTACNDNMCASFCSIFINVCGAACGDPETDAPCLEEFETEAQCIQQCNDNAMTPKTRFYDRDDNYDGFDLQCRFLHLIAAVNQGNLTHCGHANRQSSLHCGPTP